MRAVLDALAAVFALAWALRLTAGAWAWPAPGLLHGWALAGPAFAAGVALSARERRVRCALLHLALLGAWSVQHVPRLVRTADRAAAGGLAFSTLNTGVGRASPDELVHWALARDADALFLEELGAEQAAALERACAERYPFRELHGLGLRGLGVLSRRPLGATRLVELEDGSLALFGRIEVDGRALAFAVVHLSAWVALLGPWGAGDESLAHVLRELGPGATALVAGDFNATAESPLLDALGAAGFTSAFDAAGSGLGLSFPVFGRYRGLPLPPLVRIDHVFLRGLEARAASFVAGAGSDHRALDVRVEWRDH